MCEVFKRAGKAKAVDPTFSGSVTEASRDFKVMLQEYPAPQVDQVGDFAWKCYVEGFESGYSGGGGDDGWGFGAWALVVGGLGLGGLFLWNLRSL